MKRIDAEYEAALDKELAPPPLRRKGFTDELRARIEQRVEEKSTRRKSRLLLAGSLCSTAVAIAALLSFGLPELGSKSGISYETSMASAEIHNQEEYTEAVQLQESNGPFRSGLLIGLRADDKEPSYRTLYIAPKQEKPAVVAQGSGILVPYKRAFWRLDSLHYETVTDRYQFFSSRPADRREADARTMGKQLFKDDPKEKVKHSEIILFAANEYVSIAETEETAFDKLSASQTRVWTTTIPLLTTSRQQLSLNEALESAFRSPAYETDEWAVMRDRGQWAPYAVSRDDLFGDGGLRPVDAPLPDAVVNHDKTCCALPDIARALPQAKDSFTSPEEDMIVVVTDSRLLVYGGEKQFAAEPALTVKLMPKETVVMAQWATGNYVEEWAVKTAELLR